LACAVDDLVMSVSEVVRGYDLLGSAPRQALLARLLGGTPPAFAHLPLLLDPDGARLAKRGGGTTLRERRAAGTPAEAIVGLLAHSLGLVPSSAPISPHALLPLAGGAALAGRSAVRLAETPAEP
jgi:glutamyl-tRNA synthetase